MKILIIGGDERQNYLFYELKKLNYDVTISFMEKTNKFSIEIEDFNSYKIIILPFPISKDNLTLNSPYSDKKLNLSKLINIKNKVIFGGMFPNELLNSLIKNNEIFDYSKSDKLLMYNAILTAESATSIAIENSKKSLAFNNILIVGNGRIGKSLAHILSAFYSNITVSARKQTDFDCISANGLDYIHTNALKDNISKFDYIFNTVPNLVLDEDCIINCKKDCVIIDLASMPGGVDFDACKTRGIKAIHALSLPGKYSPINAAKVILEEIKQHIH